MDSRGTPTRRARSETQDEREETDVERPAAEAGVNALEIGGQRTQGQTGARGKEMGKKGARRRPTRPGRPQGAASVPQPHQAQP